jgi:hypothetical protein
MPRELLRDRESLDAWPSTGVASYLFRGDDDRAARYEIARDLPRWLENLSAHSISRAIVPLPLNASDEVYDLVAQHADRVFVAVRVDPWDGMRGLRRLVRLAQRYPNIRAISLSPHQIYPLIAPNSREYYPVYAAACELDLTVYINVGFPGPRVPAYVQDPLHLDEVMWFFDELRVVMRHGGEPWVDTCVKMMLRWPNLYYATTAFAPKFYPKAVIDFANTRGRDKIIFAGYWPTISYERTFEELQMLPLRDEVWENFLAKNAERAFRLPALSSGA